MIDRKTRGPRRVQIYTETASYTGYLAAGLSGAPEPRLIDFLNNPRTLSAVSGTMVEAVYLIGARCRFFAGGRHGEFHARQLAIRPDKVLFAYETAAIAEDRRRDYEKRSAAQKDRVVLFAAGRYRIRGLVVGGVKRLEHPNQRFVVLTEATLTNLTVEGRKLQLDFLAIHQAAIEHYLDESMELAAPGAAE